MTTNPLVQRGVNQKVDRASLVAAVIGSVGVFLSLLTQRASWQFVVLTTALCALGFARFDGQSFARWPRTVLRFLTRSRWTACRVAVSGDHDGGLFRGPFERYWARATFRGRLDLAGSAQSIWNDFELQLRRLSTSDVPTRVSLYELRENGETSAWLCGDRSIAWPEPWKASEGPAPLLLTERWYFEGWSYLRTRDHYQAVLRVSGDSVDVGNLFLRLSPPAFNWRVSIHLEVQARSKALRRVRRASHATKSDDQFSRTLGFVTNAQREVERRNVLEREQLVVEGDALVRLVVLVTCSAESIEDLRQNTQGAVNHIRSMGARVERGYGRQLEWFGCALGASS